MQILQWLIKRANEQERECNTSSPPISDKSAEGKNLVLLKHNRAYQRRKRIEGSKLGCNNLKVFAFICGKDIPKACFGRTLNLSRIGNKNRRRDFVHSMKMKREELSRGVGIAKKEDSAAHVGKKVLPITEASSTNSTERNDQCSTVGTKDQNKGSKKKTISRMKELIRWAAAAKTEKKGKFNGQKVLQFRRHGTIKSVPDEDDQVSSESPKISFTWDVERCSTISSVYSSAMTTASFIENERAQVARSTINIPVHECGHTNCRNENWITTDSEFVVLEL